MRTYEHHVHIDVRVFQDAHAVKLASKVLDKFYIHLNLRIFHAILLMSTFFIFTGEQRRLLMLTFFIFTQVNRGFFVECGALDGERGSNTDFLESEDNWQG